MQEAELQEIRQAAQRRGLTVSEWVREVLRRARRDEPADDVARKLVAIRAASEHSYPTGDIEQMTAEIERGYRLEGRRS